LVVVVLCFAWSFASEVVYLPQVADGSVPGLIVRTTFIVFNPSSFPDTATIRLTNDAGQAMTVTLPGLGSSDHFTLTVAPGETKILQTAGTGALVAGAARVESQFHLGVSAIFTYYNGTGGFLTEAGVGASTPMDDFVIPVDASGSFNTGLALYAPSTSTLTFTLRRTDGTVAGTTSQPLSGGRHLAKFVAGGDGLFPNASNFTKGTLEVSCTTPVAAVVLRQNGNPLSNTTLPVVDKTSSSFDFNLPQIANGGDLAATNMRTTFIVFNISSSDADVDIDMRKQDGTGFPVSVQGVPNSSAESADNPAQSSSIHLTLKPGASRFLQTTGTGPLSVGSAQLTSTVPVGVSAIFTLYNGQAFLTEAGVGDAYVSDEVTLPVDISASSNTGVAIFNPEDAPAVIDIWLLDENGVSAGHLSNPLILGGHGQTAKYVSELFPGKTSFRGSMVLSCSTTEIAAVALRANNTPVSYTTLPVARGAYEGTTPTASVLLDQTKTGIGATANTVVNATLPAGFKISGTVSGSLGMLSDVSARSTASGGRVYGGTTDSANKRYVIVVPAGTYELNVCYKPDSLIPLGMPDLNFTASPTVTVNADIVRNITVPSVTLRPVMGNVTGLPGTMGTVSFASTDGKTGATAVVMSGLPYTVQLPDGTYTVSLMASALTGGQTLLGFYNVGSLTVNASTSMANFAAPPSVTLAGTVTLTGATGVPASSAITVTDTTAAQAQQAVIGCANLISGSMGMIAASGAYQLLVPQGRSLSAMIMFPVNTTGFAFFPATGRALGSLSGNRAENFNVPGLPGTVTISGKVTNSQGQGVAGVNVGAYSVNVTGATDVGFTAGAQTDGSGNYSMTVLSGANYQMTFVPPMPNP